LNVYPNSGLVSDGRRCADMKCAAPGSHRAAARCRSVCTPAVSLSVPPGRLFTVCGRYRLTVTPEELAERFGVTLDEVSVEGIAVRYNIAPSQLVPIVAAPEGQRRLLIAHWGFRPSWSTRPTLAPINARAETVATSRMFRQALRRARCLVPATGFYEWTVVPGRRRKQPYHLGLKDGGLFAFAGLYTPPDHEQQVPPTCAILTTVPNDVAAAIHDRMPVILEPDEEGRWLDPALPTLDEAIACLRPLPSARMEAYPVSTLVSSPRNEGPQLIERVPL